ncbi:TPA: hypothetical protein SD634_003389 [Vibrio cholerae]|nr:hypothetical protein [Vibrio cholerae]
MSTRPSFETAGSTVYACQQVVEYLKPLLEGGERDIDKVEVVERHIGRLNTQDELKRWMGSRDGGIRIAALNSSDYERIGGAIIGTVTMAAYIFAADKYGYQRDERAEVIAGQLVIAMMASSMPPNAYGNAMNIRCDNLYSGSIDSKGVAMWSVTWSQKWQLNEPIDLATLDDFITFDFKGEIAEGAPLIEGEQTLPQEEE